MEGYKRHRRGAEATGAIADPRHLTCSGVDDSGHETVELETLQYERRGHVGWLRLNRPTKLNAMNALMWSELAELGPRLRDDPDLRALVVIGNGRAFSAGIDLSSFSDPAAAPAGSPAASSSGAK